MSAKVHGTREEWLQAAVSEFAEYIGAETGKDVPRVRVGVGFPSAGLRGNSLAECWTPSASGDGTHEIFIRADRMPDAEQRQSILDTLLHEVCHAVAGIPAGHGPDFKAVATAVGLEGKMTATLPSDTLREALQDWTQYGSLGAYPMARFTPPVAGADPTHSGGHGRSHSGPGKQPVRQLKVWCPSDEWDDGAQGTGCGYTLRTTEKWLAVAMPTCPNPECERVGRPMSRG